MLLIQVLTIIGLVLAISASGLTLVATIRNRKKIEEVHVMVDGNLSAVVNRVDQLTATLERANVRVPSPPKKAGP